LVGMVSVEHANIILQKCRGVDESPVVDDEGGLPKTVSVENSFRRGTVTTEKAVCDAMEDLYKRLPRLLRERATWSDAPGRAYPSTLRLTVRSVVRGEELHATLKRSRRRPFVTRSKQVPFDGQEVLQGKAREDKLRRLVEPLLRSLVLSSNDINVTRLSIAVADFQDTSPARSKMQVARIPSESHTVSLDTKAYSAVGMGSAYGKLQRSKQNAHEERRAAFMMYPTADQIDPCVLAELPEDIASEVQNNLRNSKAPKRRRIDHFFARRDQK